MKLIKKFLRSVKSKGGYTLIEIAAVVAITATLGAVVVPIAVDKVSEGKKVAANDSTKAIGGAITAFFKDTGNYPAASAADSSGSGTVYYQTLRSGAEIGNVSTTAAIHDPTFGVSGTNGWIVGNADVLDNHLTQDNPGGTPNADTANSAYVLKHKFVNWKGPYSEPFANNDPWGHNYLVYVKAMYNATSGDSKEYGWILSAGPNGKIETNTLDPKLKGDDIGYALYSAEIAH